MAYCRWGDADIYLYPAVGGGVTCCGCSFAPKVRTLFTTGSERWNVEACGKCNGAGCDDCMMHGDTSGMSFVEAMAHVKTHIEAGHYVPPSVLGELQADLEAEEEDG